LLQNFGFAMRTTHLGKKWCDRAWPGPLAPTPLLPHIVNGGVALTPQAVTDDGISNPRTTGVLEIVLKCDPEGEEGVARPVNASLISDGPASAMHVPYRLELASKCACPGGCGGSASPAATAAAAAPAPTSPLTANATMPADGTFIVRLQHLYGPSEALGEMSEPATVDLADLFCASGKQITAVQETSMSANQRAEDIHHWKWERRGERHAAATTTARLTEREGAGDRSSSFGHNATVVVLQPMTTRTFVIAVDDNQ
jgi:hypothetical protein